MPCPDPCGGWLGRPGMRGGVGMVGPRADSPKWKTGRSGPFPVDLVVEEEDRTPDLCITERSALPAELPPRERAVYQIGLGPAGGRLPASEGAWPGHCQRLCRTLTICMARRRNGAVIGSPEPAATRQASQGLSVFHRKETTWAKGSKTEQNLKDAFAGESQANRRYLYFANKADMEGQNDVAALFRPPQRARPARARPPGVPRGGGRPGHRLPIGSTGRTLAAVAGETHEYTDMYPGMARRRARKVSTRDRRLVRDAGQGRALARQPLPKALDALVD